MKIEWMREAKKSCWGEKFDDDEQMCRS